MANWVKRRWGRLLLGLLALGALLAASQIGDGVQATSATAKAVKKVKTKSIKGIVTDSQGRILVGATVYFIDTSLLDLTPILPLDTSDRSAEDRDEPLEDIIRDDVKRASLPQAVTDSKGRFKAKLPVTKHFAWVEPNNSDYLPGGSVSRTSFLPTSLPKKTGLAIQVSWEVPDTATHIGSTACLVCHDGGLASDQRGWGGHAHALMYTRASGPTAIQDFSRHAGWDAFANKFLPGTVPTDGTVLYFMDWDKTQSYHFEIFEGTPGPGTVFFEVYLWKDQNDGNKSKITIVNIANGSDGNSPQTYEAAGFIGGYIRQRLLLKIEPTRQGFNRSFNFQAIPGASSQGVQTNYDRARKPWTEKGSGGGSFTDLLDETVSPPVLKAATSVTKSTINCASCHNFAGLQTNKTVGGEALFTTVGDPNGVLATGEVADGLQELGITCEQCHGPGSEHRAEALLPDEVISKKQVISHKGKFIINPDYLSVGRASLVCGRCHSGIEITDPWPKLGDSREQFIEHLVEEGDPTGPPGAHGARLWPDEIHEKGGHHGLSYTTYLTSVHYRNDRLLVACFDCHKLHGETDFRYGLKADPDDSAAGLCQTCHMKDIRQHMEDKTGDDMKGLSTKCYECHMPRTGTGGAGKPGLFIGTPTGDPAIDPDIVYWYGDQASHVWDVPSKMSVGVANVQPAQAMPTPYTNNCGTCHNPSALPFLPPEP